MELQMPSITVMSEQIEMRRRATALQRLTALQAELDILTSLRADVTQVLFLFLIRIYSFTSLKYEKAATHTSQLCNPG